MLIAASKYTSQQEKFSAGKREWLHLLQLILMWSGRKRSWSLQIFRLFQNHSSQMAALDYLVYLESDVFVPTYDGNMAKVVEGHRRYLGFRKTIVLNRKLIVELIDRYSNGTLGWDEFSSPIKAAHADRMGMPLRRVAVPDRPKEEGYFYANPQECLQQAEDFHSW